MHLPSMAFCFILIIIGVLTHLDLFIVCSMRPGLLHTATADPILYKDAAIEHFVFNRIFFCFTVEELK